MDISPARCSTGGISCQPKSFTSRLPTLSRMFALSPRSVGRFQEQATTSRLSVEEKQIGNTKAFAYGHYPIDLVVAWFV